MENTLSVAPVEHIVGRFVACCTNNSSLHLFESREEFIEFTREHSASEGLIMAWIDGVRVHAERGDTDCKTSQELIEFVEGPTSEVIQ